MIDVSSSEAETIDFATAGLLLIASAGIPQFKPALQQERHKHGVAKTPNTSVSKPFLTLAPNERQFRSDHHALMIDVLSEAETYWICYIMLVPRALNTGNCGIRVEYQIESGE